MKKTTKVLLTIVCAAAIAAVSVLGTAALLTKKTGPVTNTFVNGKLLSGDFLLEESPAVQQADGTYLLDETAPGVTENTYMAIPGMSLPKDPHVTVELADNIKAYLFLEVIDDLPAGACTWYINSDNWTKLVAGADSHPVLSADGNPIYVYKAGNPFGKADAADDIGIISENIVAVSSECEEGDFTADSKLEFKAYLCQAYGFDNAAEAWEACFDTIIPVP